MSTGLKANSDGSAAIQVGGTDYLTVTSGGAVTIPGTFAVTSTSTFTGAITATGGIAGDLRFNSGYGSVATAYGCRAWVNFNGGTNTNLAGTYSQSGTTVTVTATAHGLIAGNIVYSLIGTGTAVTGVYTVATVTDANTFTYTAGTSLTTSGNITLTRNTIRASGNVSSVADAGVGDYIVNFSTAMPDVNYAAVFGTTWQSGTALNTLYAADPTTARTTTALRVYATCNTGASNSAQDPSNAQVAIFR